MGFVSCFPKALSDPTEQMKWILDSLSITNKDAWALVLHIFEYTVLTRAYPVIPR
jgi:hypothetical protein